MASVSPGARIRSVRSPCGGYERHALWIQFIALPHLQRRRDAALRSRDPDGDSLPRRIESIEQQQVLAAGGNRDVLSRRRIDWSGFVPDGHVDDDRYGGRVRQHQSATAANFARAAHEPLLAGGPGARARHQSAEVRAVGAHQLLRRETWSQRPHGSHGVTHWVLGVEFLCREHTRGDGRELRRLLGFGAE